MRLGVIESCGDCGKFIRPHGACKLLERKVREGEIHKDCPLPKAHAKTMVNKKKGESYKTLAMADCATNACDECGVVMVYVDEDGRIYVRNSAEFSEKFVPAEGKD